MEDENLNPIIPNGEDTTINDGESNEEINSSEDNTTPNEDEVSTQLVELKRQVEIQGMEFDDDTLIRELEWSKQAINNRLCVPYDKEIEKRYEGIQIQLCIEALSKYGADGETSHDENGISRNYDSASRYSKSTLSLIIPRIGVVL